MFCSLAFTCLHPRGFEENTSGGQVPLSQATTLTLCLPHNLVISFHTLVIPSQAWQITEITKFSTKLSQTLLSRSPPADWHRRRRGPPSRSWLPTVAWSRDPSSTWPLGGGLGRGVTTCHLPRLSEICAFLSHPGLASRHTATLKQPPAGVCCRFEAGCRPAVGRPAVSESGAVNWPWLGTAAPTLGWLSQVYLPNSSDSESAGW